MLFSSFKAINDNRRSNLRCVLHHHSISYIPWALFRQLLLRLPGNQLYPVDVIKTNVNNNKNNLFKFVPFFPNQTDHLFIALQRRAFLVENKQWFHPRDAWEDSKVKNTVAHSNRDWHFFVTGIKGAVLVQKPIQKQQHSLSPRKRLSREFYPEKLSTWIFRGFLKYIASKHEDIGLLFRFQSFSILEILSYRSQKLNPVLLTKFL